MARPSMTRLVPAVVLLALLAACAPSPHDQELTATLAMTQRQLVDAQQEIINLTQALQLSDTELRNAQQQCALIDVDRGYKDTLQATQASRDDCYGQLGVAQADAQDYRTRYEACTSQATGSNG